MTKTAVTQHDRRWAKLVGLTVWSSLFLLVSVIAGYGGTEATPPPYRFGPRHHQPQLAPDSSVMFYLETSVENVWMYNPALYRVDAEVSQVLGQVKVRPRHDLEISLGIPLRYMSGGVLDRVIEEFHSFFGLGDADRPVADREDLAVITADPNNGEKRVWIDARENGWSLDEPVLEATLQLPTSDLDLAAHSFVRLPLTAGPANLAGYLPRAGLSVGAGRGVGSFYASLSGGLAYVSRDKYLGVDLRRWLFSGAVSLSYHPAASDHWWYFQGDASEGAARDFASLSETRYQVKFGYVRRLNDVTLLEVGVLENVFRFDNTPDFGLHIGLTRQL